MQYVRSQNWEDGNVGMRSSRNVPSKVFKMLQKQYSDETGKRNFLFLLLFIFIFILCCYLFRYLLIILHSMFTYQEALSSLFLLINSTQGQPSELLKLSEI